MPAPDPDVPTDTLHEALHLTTIILAYTQLLRRTLGRNTLPDSERTRERLYAIEQACWNLATLQREIADQVRIERSRLIAAERRMDELRRLVDGADPDVATIRRVLARG